ncbi:S1 family peptidase [Ornithinibacillus gellani]|uniref:S1 family peptidase n=1 Tax=Ornithinibacillus gellani TaxID=2293253 RepID=UPI001CC1F95F|nr:serine protease [Ornithinibacillus gellani]
MRGGQVDNEEKEKQYANDRDSYTQDIIDEDLYEEFDDEELYRLVEEARQEALLRAAKEKENKTPKRPFPKWAFWLIVVAMVLNVGALLPQTFSIPIFEFLMTSTKLSTKAEIKEYKQAIVVVETQDGRGTGFSVSNDGMIITNHHVIEGADEAIIGFPEDGLFTAEVVADFPEIDLAVLQLQEDEQQLPALKLAQELTFKEEEAVYFIGNPLRFNGIANQGTIIDYIQLKSWKDGLPVVMMDAPVYRGNSGSPVLNNEGQVIGVVFATLDHSSFGKVGLFVPIDYLYEAVKSQPIDL